MAKSENNNPDDRIYELQEELEQHKKLHHALLNAAQQWRDIFDNIIDIICMTKKDGAIMRCNKSMQKYLKVPFEEILGKNVHDFFHFETEAPGKCLIDRVNQSLKREEASYSLNNRRYLVIVDPLFDTSGEYTAMIHTMVDITDREQLADKLQQTNELLNNILESSSSISIISSDLEHRILYWNKGAQNLYGYASDEAIGKDTDMIYSKEEQETQKIAVARKVVFEDGKEISFEIKQIKKDGTPIWVNLTISPRRNNHGKIIGAIGIGEDITLRKLTEEEKEKLEEQLLQVQKMEAIGTLAGGVAHDFNNLLTIIRGNVDMALARINETNPLYTDLTESRNTISRAANLTKQLLLFSRKHPIKHTCLNINRIIMDLARMLERIIGENIKISLELGADLMSVNSDEGYIEQAITNLIVNARDAMPAGGTITVKTYNKSFNEEESKNVPLSRAGNFVCFCVKDTGTGIAKEQLSRIFEPFFTTKKPGEGTGLGLSVVYGIIKQHNGWINIDTEVGKGTEFRIYLPAVNMKEDRLIIDRVSSGKLKGRGEKILVVEDEELICKHIKRSLSGANYHVFDARNAKDALSIFNDLKGGVDVAVCDMKLTDMTGLELVDKLISVNPAVKVIFISGYIDDKLQWPVIEKKGYSFLQKPFGMDELLITLREVLDK